MIMSDLLRHSHVSPTDIDRAGGDTTSALSLEDWTEICALRAMRAFSPCKLFNVVDNECMLTVEEAYHPYTGHSAKGRPVSHMMQNLTV